MEFTLNYLLENLAYDLIVDSSITFHGSIEYVTQHVADGDISSELQISKTQSSKLQKFVNEYFEARKLEPELSISNFYIRKAI